MNPNKWHALIETINFYSAAHAVFERLILGQGPGLLVLWGGLPGELPKANKSYFLDAVESLQDGMKIPQNEVPESLRDLLAKLEPGHYQCVRVKGELFTLPNGKPSYTPLAVAVSMALATAAQRPGLTAGRNLVLLCDDLQVFMCDVTNAIVNHAFLRSLALCLDSQQTITFLGAAQRTWEARAALDPNHLLGNHVFALGWD